MIAIVSPSKTMKEEKVSIRTTKPLFPEDTALLSKEMRSYDVQGLENLMKISEDLAVLNYERFQNFEKASTYPALYLFRGDVFKGLDVDTLEKEEVSYLSKHLRILSGLYGLLRPLDAMKPYRLEMGTKHANARGKDLYAFWGDIIRKQLEKDAKDEILVNLASQEYAKAARLEETSLQVVHIEFREKKNGKYPIVAFYAKVARGEMARFMAKNNVQTIEELKSFDYSDYAFNEELSTENTLVFTRG